MADIARYIVVSTTHVASTRGWATALPKRPTTTTSAGGKPHSYYVTTSSVVDDLSEFSGADHQEVPWPRTPRGPGLRRGCRPPTDRRRGAWRCRPTSSRTPWLRRGGRGIAVPGSSCCCLAARCSGSPSCGTPDPLGQRGGGRGDECGSGLVVQQLQREGAADHDVPLDARKIATPDPVAPPSCGGVAGRESLRGHLGDGSGREDDNHALALAEHRVQRGLVLFHRDGLRRRDRRCRAAGATNEQDAITDPQRWRPFTEAAAGAQGHVNRDDARSPFHHPHQQRSRPVLAGHCHELRGDSVPSRQENVVSRTLVSGRYRREAAKGTAGICPTPTSW